MENTASYFEKLSEIGIKKHVEKKNRFDYLSWAHAWSYLKKSHPEATFKVHEYDGSPYKKTDAGYFVKVTVTVEGIEHTQVHPVLNNYNKPIENPDAFQINTSIQRCLAKCIALHGLGLSLYTGEDIPDNKETDSDLIVQGKKGIDLFLNSYVAQCEDKKVPIEKNKGVLLEKIEQHIKGISQDGQSEQYIATELRTYAEQHMTKMLANAKKKS